MTNKTESDKLTVELERTRQLELDYSKRWAARLDDGQDHMRRLGLSDVVAEEVLIIEAINEIP